MPLYIHFSRYAGGYMPPAKLVLELGPSYFEVTPSHGARITSLRRCGAELLVQTGSENFVDASALRFGPAGSAGPGRLGAGG